MIVIDYQFIDWLHMALSIAMQPDGIWEIRITWQVSTKDYCLNVCCRYAMPQGIKPQVGVDKSSYYAKFG